MGDYQHFALFLLQMPLQVVCTVYMESIGDSGPGERKLESFKEIEGSSLPSISSLQDFGVKQIQTDSIDLCL